MPHAFSKIVIFLLVGFGLLSCVGNNKKVFDINEIIGEIFILPAYPEWGVLDRDTTMQLSGRPKMVVYFAAGDCMPCALRELRHWKPIVRQIESLRSEGIFVDPLFILQTDRDNERVKEALVEQGFAYPVMYDERGEFEEHNLLPTSSLMHTFLLNSDHKVMWVGNPLLSLKQQKTFESLLRGFGKNSPTI